MSTSNRRKFIATASLASLSVAGVKGMSTSTDNPIHKGEEMLDLTDFPVIDHHHHEYSLDAMKSPDPARFTSMFYHGERNDGYKADGPSGMSKALNTHIANTGVVLATVSELSRLFGCADNLETVVAERYRRIMADAAGYTKMLYSKAKIEAIVLDDREGTPPLIPTKIYRLVPNDKIFKECLKTCDNIETFRKTFITKIEEKLSDKEYIAVKSHVGEQTGLDVEELSFSAYQAAYQSARLGDVEAWKKIYRLSFIDLTHYCCEKGVPIHIHTGTTGDMRSVLPINQTLDPLLLAPYLKRPELRRLKIVLLHGGHPWVQHAALMAYNFPNVYLDLSWMFPWNVLGLKNLFHDVLTIAPVSKIFYGGGCHSGPETAYMGATVLKKVVGDVLSELVKDQFLTFGQANEIAHMILHKNAETYYNL
ncbi:amidohydrolase family protein [Sunxiuqinia sp. A32]|uniref:amidohydrolase family protein n=1 Tax=Sunxiuqinia sp. A32 TaxID=3461496 RepID=UPI0040452F82